MVETRAASGLHVPTQALDVCASGLEQVQPALLAPGGEHAQVQCVGVAGQPAVAGQEPSERGLLIAGEQRFDRHDKVGLGHGGGHGDLRDSGRSLASSERHCPSR